MRQQIRLASSNSFNNMIPNKLPFWSWVNSLTFTTCNQIFGWAVLKWCHRRIIEEHKLILPKLVYGYHNYYHWNYSANGLVFIDFWQIYFVRSIAFVHFSINAAWLLILGVIHWGMGSERQELIENEWRLRWFHFNRKECKSCPNITYFTYASTDTHRTLAHTPSHTPISHTHSTCKLMNKDAHDDE